MRKQEQAQEKVSNNKSRKDRKAAKCFPLKLKLDRVVAFFLFFTSVLVVTLVRMDHADEVTLSTFVLSVLSTTVVWCFKRVIRAIALYLLQKYPQYRQIIYNSIKWGAIVIRLIRIIFFMWW